MKFGDILRYPDDQGVGDSILFMFLGKCRRKLRGHSQTYLDVMVLRTAEDDDEFEPGETLLAGVDELIPYVEPKGTRLIVDGKDISDEVEFVGVDIAAGSSTAVFGIRDASGTFTITDVKVSSPDV